MNESSSRSREGHRGVRLGVLRCAALAGLIMVGLIGRSLPAQDIAGTWQGTMQAGKEQRIVVKVSKTDAGWQGVFHNLDGNNPAEGHATTQMSLQGAELRFAIAATESSYTGKLSDDGASIAGTWTQGSVSYPLNLARVTDDAIWEIPKADAMMPADADPDWDVVSVKVRDPNDPSGSQSLGMRGRQFSISNKTVANMMQFAYGV